ncbi:hypothetical protein [Deinococcus aquatilis]|uniref:hypothetical protein n=1 Tax=Deinococcus aquatilis TaxID=519440 RepID=UPI0012FBDB82|nr:hypothetical protein [Deinococcus aquatilis]
MLGEQGLVLKRMRIGVQDQGWAGEDDRSAQVVPQVEARKEVTMNPQALTRLSRTERSEIGFKSLSQEACHIWSGVGDLEQGALKPHWVMC